MRKNYFKQLFAAMVTLFISATVSAHDFEVDGIYYNIIGENEVSVTFQGEDSGEYTHEYIGHIEIPEVVTYEGKTYNVTTLGRYAFDMNSYMKQIRIPNSITKIEECAFRHCTGLTNLIIPNSVTHIEDYAFVFCRNVTELTISNNIKSMGIYPFQDWDNLKNVVIPDCLTSVVWGMFYGCDKLEDVTIPSSVTIIDKYAFSDCKALKNIVIPKNVTEIGESAFYRCYELTTIYMNPTTPPVAFENSFTFSKDTYTKATLYVPKGSIDAYKAASVWREFINIQEYEATSMDNIDANNITIKATANGILISNADGKSVTVHSTNGYLVETIDNYAGEEITLDKGFYIVCVGNKTMKVKL